MKFAWTPDLTVQVKEMDDQHKVLIQKIDELIEALNANNPKKKELFVDLANYVVKHFQEEEAYMEKIGFPGIAGHKLIHQKLLQDVGGFKQQFETNTLDTFKFQSFLQVWLASHIKGIDRKYGEFSIQHKKVS